MVWGHFVGTAHEESRVPRITQSLDETKEEA